MIIFGVICEKTDESLKVAFANYNYNDGICQFHVKKTEVLSLNCLYIEELDGSSVEPGMTTPPSLVDLTASTIGQSHACHQIEQHQIKDDSLLKKVRLPVHSSDRLNKTVLTFKPKVKPR